MTRAYLIVIATLLSAPAHAAQCDGTGPDLKEPALCSKLFVFEGFCGRTTYPAWTPDVVFAVGPWEKTLIRIFAVSADTVVRATWRAAFAKMFVGNSFNADPMTAFVTASGGVLDLSGRVAVPVHAEQHFSTGMQFAAPGPEPLVPHLDVHLICEPDGAPFFGSLTVWYALDR
jgi:hypothetical protein